MGSELQYAAIDRQILEARNIEERQQKFERSQHMLAEVQEARSGEKDLATRVNRAGADYQAEFEKKAGGAVLERDAKGEVTGFDFSKGGDIYGSGSEAAADKSAKKQEPAAADKSKNLVESGVEAAKDSKAAGGDAVSKADEISGS